MKFFALFVIIFAIALSAMALKNDFCDLPHSADGRPDGLRCLALFRLWSYNKDSNECEKFIYGGCGGNDNRFHSQEECEQKCKE